MYRYKNIWCGLVWILSVLFLLTGCEQKSEPPKAQIVRKKIVAKKPPVRRAQKSKAVKSKGAQASFRPKSAISKTPKAMLAKKSKQPPAVEKSKNAQKAAASKSSPGKILAVKPKSVISKTPKALKDKEKAPQITAIPPPSTGKKPKSKTKRKPTTVAAKSKIKAPKDKRAAPGAKTTVALTKAETRKPYDPAGKIDPFEPLFTEKPKITQARRKIRKRTPRTPLEKIALSQLRLVGIVMASSGNKALVEEASGKGYIIKKGTYIGLNSGKVIDIQKDNIVISEEVEDVLGKVTVRKREIRLPKPTGE